MAKEHDLQDYLTELAQLESIMELLAAAPRPTIEHESARSANPTLHVIPCQWVFPKLLLERPQDPPNEPPERGNQIVMLWKDPATGRVCVKEATSEDLLALKLVVEEIPIAEAALASGTTPAALNYALRRAAELGILLAPLSKIRRGPDFPSGDGVSTRFFTSSNFTLQWHITNACDLDCLHCYDRSRRKPVELSMGLDILEQLSTFCSARNVTGHVSFSGGNPLLHPGFFDLYSEASARGFTLSILGNPTDFATLQRIVAVQPPTYFQVSLEGLEEHNDKVRGKGFYRRVIAFLELLRTADVESQVMLTLTAANMDQVIPLARALKGHTDAFLFNRLAETGEGANLDSPDPASYSEFLKTYQEFASGQDHVYLKDNLHNRLRYARGLPLFGGCTGFGCGAAFNFLSLLPDGEIHACRKLPSRLGNIGSSSLADIYDSPLAQRYREGCSACFGCAIRPACGGCLAVAHGSGLNIFEERDPYCRGPLGGQGEIS